MLRILSNFKVRLHVTVACREVDLWLVAVKAFSGARVVGVRVAEFGVAGRQHLVKLRPRSSPPTDALRKRLVISRLVWNITYLRYGQYSRWYLSLVTTHIRVIVRDCP